MGKYKKINRKKEKTEIIDMTDTGTAGRLVDEYGDKILMVAGGLLVLALVFYGTRYYKKVSFEESNTALFRVISKVESTGASKSSADSAMADLDRLAKGASSSQVALLAGMQRAHLLLRSGSAVSSAEAYRDVAEKAENKSLIKEIAMAGSARAYITARDLNSAEKVLEELVKDPKYYPESSALRSLIFVKAGLGKVNEALQLLDRLKSNFPSDIQADYLDDITRRIRNGEISKLEAAGFLPEVKETKQPEGEHAIGVHGG